VAHLQLTLDESVGRAVVVVAIDNLTKGTAGGAIQCANLALGLPETSGLPVAGVAP
jgi:N-acetyl-gamma-glutamyl-phosphate reductase